MAAHSTIEGKNAFNFVLKQGHRQNYRLAQMETLMRWTRTGPYPVCWPTTRHQKTNPFDLSELKRLHRPGWLSRMQSVKGFQRPAAVVPQLAPWYCIISCITYCKPIGLWRFVKHYVLFEARSNHIWIKSMGLEESMQLMKQIHGWLEIRPTDHHTLSSWRSISN